MRRVARFVLGVLVGGGVAFQLRAAASRVVVACAAPVVRFLSSLYRDDPYGRDVVVAAASASTGETTTRPLSR